MLDQEVIVIDEFKGLYDRGETNDQNVTQIQPGFFKTLTNFYHQGESLISRPGTQTLGYGIAGGNFLRFWPYRHPTTGQDQFIILYFDTVGVVNNIRDTSAGVGLNALTTSEFFNLFIIRDKLVGGAISTNVAFNQPLGSGNLKIYRFDGVAFRNAAGLSPSPGVVMVAATGAAGKVEAGVHLIAVAYETNTGFITPPGPFVATVYTPTQYTAPGGAAINLTVIPLGPAGTVARHILVSKIIRPPFNGDVLVPELFFAPAGKINDNTTTTLTISFYDSELVSSADYLLDELEIIPAGTCYCTYRNRLIIVGFPPTAAAPGVGGITLVPSYIARVSNPGAYESFSAIEGFIQVLPNDGDALQACWEQNGNLYLAKGNRTYVTRDNGGPPNTWEVSLVDAAIGCGPWGVTKIDNSQNGLIEGGAIIGSRRGIYFFTGQYASIPLTYNIEAMYRRRVASLTDPAGGGYAVFFYSKFHYDSYRRLLYCMLATHFNQADIPIMVGACDNGLKPENIRWSDFGKFDTAATGLSGSYATTFPLDISATVQSPDATNINAMLFIIINNTIMVMKTSLSLDVQTTGSFPTGNRIYWELTSFPAEVEELDKMQIVGARALMKHDNPDDPIDFNFTGYDYTYNEFTPDAIYTFGDNEFPPRREMVVIPQLYDTPINLRSKLIGISLKRGIHGGNISTILVPSTSVITNSVFIHRLMLFGNRAAQGKLQGSIR